MGKDLKGKELGKGISQRADGRYIARFTSKTGKRKTLYDFKLNELKRKLREAVYEDEHGLNGNGESITLNAWHVTWTELYKKKTVKMTTIYKNHSYYNARVKNSIGKMYLQDIKTYHVQKFINELIDSGLAHGTVSNIRFMLSDMFDKAVLSEYIRKNPCIGVEMPKEVKKERRVLTREEQEKFFTFAFSYIHINVLKFAVTTGCRIGDD
ncbi:integrase DNA-binding domain-containing protein, partial [Eubacterium sp.]|uniref:integrase DNA-binding domain-containing protein n=2 Tax=Eubacterium sp. TaxID=142586 RepID=UPI003522AC2B